MCSFNVRLMRSVMDGQSRTLLPPAGICLLGFLEKIEIIPEIKVIILS
jgi:hypothetical protein